MMGLKHKFRAGWIALLLLLCAFLPSESGYFFPFERHFQMSGSYGELRSNHFHAGIDLKTGGKTGIEVHAVAEGHVYRVKVSPYGYGKAVYLQHRDGRRSLYGHLDGFAPAIAEAVRAAQYASQQTNQEFYFPPSALPVKGGDLIAYSGNTGSSGGPHLHFEIRDSADRPLNPLAYYRSILTDRRPPVVQEVAFEPMGPVSRVNGAWEKSIYRVSGGNGQYRWDGVAELFGPAGFEFRAHDLLDSAENPCGLTGASLWLDGRQIWAFELEQFDFDETRMINLHLDYRQYQRDRRRFQRAYIEAGNRFSALRPALGEGVFSLDDEAVHELRLELWDLHGNRSMVSGQVRRGQPFAALPALPAAGAAPSVSWQVRRGVLRVELRRPSQAWAEGLQWEDALGGRHPLEPAYAQGGNLYFLETLDPFRYPLRLLGPAGQELARFHFREEIFPDRNHLAEAEGMQALFPAGALFAPFHLEIEALPPAAGSRGQRFRVGDEDEPVRRNFLLSFPAAASPGMAVAFWEGGRWSYASSRRGRSGELLASVSRFGVYALLRDSLPPRIQPGNFAPGKKIPEGQRLVSLRVADDFAGLDADALTCTLDGAWQPFEYDYKRDLIIWDLGGLRPAPGLHSLEVRAADVLGNETRQTFSLLF